MCLERDSTGTINMRDVRWGIIGCGDVTEVKSGPALQLASGSELVAVMRRNGELAADYAKRHGVPRWYDDADELIADPNVSAVYVATPPGSHCEYALRVAAGGKPAYIEKPMARNHDECRSMVEAFRNNGLKLFVAYYRRELPRFQKAKELIDSGCLGTVTAVSYRYAEPHRDLDRSDLPWRLQAEHSGGGLFFDLGSHALDMLDFLLGPLKDVGGVASNLVEMYHVEDNVVMHFRAGSGIPGTASWNFAACEHEDRITVTGTRGVVSLSVFGDEAVQCDTPNGQEMFDLPNPMHIQQPLIQTIVNDLRGTGTCCSTGESATRTSAVMDAVTANYYGTRKNDFWERLGD